MGEIFNIENILNFFNYVFWFFILNLFFMILNIPMVSFLTFVGISKISTYLPLFLLCLIPVGPSFATLLYCMGKLIRNKDLNIIGDFIKGLKLNFKQSLLIWFFELILIFILYSNITFFSNMNNGTIISCIFIGLSLILVLVTPYIFVLLSRFSMTAMELIRASLILAFTRPLLTITNLIVFLFTLMLFEITPAVTIIFIASILSFLLVFVNKALLKELETSS